MAQSRHFFRNRTRDFAQFLSHSINYDWISISVKRTSNLFDKDACSTSNISGTCQNSIFGFLQIIHATSAALVPPPRTHRHRYFGVLAPNSSLRTAVTPRAQPATRQIEPAITGEGVRICKIFDYIGVIRAPPLTALVRGPPLWQLTSLCEGLQKPPMGNGKLRCSFFKSTVAPPLPRNAEPPRRNSDPQMDSTLTCLSALGI